MTKPQLDNALHSLFAQGRDPMFITDKRGRFSHVNPAFLDLYQYDEAAIMGQTMRMLLQPSLHDVVFYKSILRRLLEHESWVGELNIVTRTGEIIPVWTQILRVTDGFSALQVDLRERDKVSRKLDMLSRLQSVSTLAGGIAHEFNNILGGMQGHLYLLKRSVKPEQTKDHDRLFRLDTLMQRAAALVKNLLAFSKQQSTTTRELALVPMLEESVEMAQRAIGKRIDLKLHAQNSNWLVAVDPVLFKHHIFELIQNSARALHRQREQAQGDLAEHITVKVCVVDEHGVEISIADNGGGMDAATLHHCMDPFFTTQAVGQGTGLGLSSAMSYMQQLSGTLDIESIEGSHTTVRIRLPLVVNFTAPSEKGGMVLLVDDDEAQRFALQEVLLYHGYQVLTAEDGLQGLALWREHGAALDAVVMDIVMPNMDGIEVARVIRNDHESIPICLMTGYTYQRIPSSLHVNLMRKPLNSDLLVEYLQRTISSL